MPILRRVLARQDGARAVLVLPELRREVRVATAEYGPTGARRVSVVGLETDGGTTLASLYATAARAAATLPIETRSDPSLPLAVAAARSGSEGVPTPEDRESWTRLYESLVAVHTCVDLISQAVGRGALDLRRGNQMLGGSTPSRGMLWVDRVRAINARVNRAMAGRRGWRSIDAPDARPDPIADLLLKVNEQMSLRELLVRTCIDLCLTGDGYWRIVRGSPAGSAEELWPLKSFRTKVKPRKKENIPPGGDAFDYVYTIAGGKPETIPGEDVIHFIDPSPVDDFYGLTGLRAATRTLMSDEALEKSLNAMLRNGTRPSGSVMLDKDTPEKMVKLAVDSWKAAYSGVENDGKTVFVVGGREYKPIQFSPAEMQSLDLRSWNRDQILQVLHVPKFIYGIRDTSSTRENVWMEERLFYEGAVFPLADIIDTTLEEVGLAKLRLGSTDGVTCKLRYEHLAWYQELQAERALADAPMLDRGVYVGNEIRARFGLDPTPWGDSWWGPMSTIEIAGGASAPPSATPEPNA